MNFDVLIRGGRVHAGTGGPPIVADVAVHDGKIHDVAPRVEASAGQVIDATGLDVVPGFIDLHGHSDFALVLEPSGESLLRQGVTTQLVGNCGASAFPLRAGHPPPKFDPTNVSASWATAEEYFHKLGRARPSPNVGSLVGLGTVRQAALHSDARPADAQELKAIVDEIEDAFVAGALGVSFGLHFEPDLRATEAELLSVAEVAARWRRPVAIHLRDYGEHLESAVDEALRLGQSSGAPIHLSLLHAFGRSAHGRLEKILARLDAARATGVQVTCEALLWPTVGAWHGLRAVLPPDVHDWRNPDWPSLQELTMGSARLGLAEAIESRRAAPKVGFYEEYLIFSDWRDLRLLNVGPGSTFAPYVEKNLEEIARELDRAPVDIFLDLVAEDPSRLMLLHQTLSEDDVEACLQWPHSYIGLDAIATSIPRQQELWNTMQFHPRHFAGTARLFATHVRERALLTAEEALRRLTAGPASVWGLDDRGVIRPGNWADIAILNLDEFAPTGTWLEPVAPPAGLRQVIVNGKCQLADGVSDGTGDGQLITPVSPYGAIVQ